MTYDDFESGTLDLWAVTQIGGTAAASTDAYKYGAYGCRYVTDGHVDDDTVRCVNMSESAAIGNYYAWVRISNAGGSFEYLIQNASNQNIGSIRNNYAPTGSNLRYQTGFTWVAFTTSISANTWYRLRIDYDGSLVDYYIYDLNNALLESKLNQTVGEGSGNVEGVRFLAYDVLASSFNCDWDNVCYTSTSDEPPPSVGRVMTPRKYW